MKKRTVYADWAAGAPLHPAAQAVLRRFLDEPVPLNPSALHGYGMRAHAVLEEGRRMLARAAGWSPEEITFTGGGTEGAVLAVRSLAALAGPGRRRIVLSPFEHPAVREAVLALDGFSPDGGGPFRMEECLANPDGTVDLSDFGARMGPDVAFCGVMAVQNETGVIQPVRECAALVHGCGGLLLTDGVQAAGHISLRFGCTDGAELPDIVILSGHKFGGPAGTGALLHRVPLCPVQKGGGQENGRRGGTENVMGLTAMAAAASAWSAEPGTADGPVLAPDRMARLRDRLETELTERIPGLRIAGLGSPRLPSVSYVIFPGGGGPVGENLVLSCDLAGLAVSAGSACHRGSPEPSRTLLAMGMSPAAAQRGVRLSFGCGTAEAEMELAFRILGDTAAPHFR